MMTVPDHSLQDLNHDGIFFRVQDIDFLFGKGHFVARDMPADHSLLTSSGMGGAQAGHDHWGNAYAGA